MAKFKMLPNGTVFEDLIESQTITPATSYNDLSDKPAINSVEIKGNKTSAQLGLMGKDEAYIKEEVDELIANIERGLTYKVVEELPTTGIDTRTIYLVPDEEDEGVMQQYLYISNDWVSLGSTEIDLSDYFTKSEINSKLAMRVPVQQATTDAGKVLKVGSTGLVDVYPLNLYQHNIQLADGDAGAVGEVRAYFNFITTSSTAITTVANLLTEIRTVYDSAWFDFGGWYKSDASTRCTPGRGNVTNTGSLQLFFNDGVDTKGYYATASTTTASISDTVCQIL